MTLPPILLGTSSFTASGWAGSFYPKGMRPAEYLTFYAQNFPAVEVDSTFYACPSVQTVRNWAARTPEGFTFAVKVPQSVTHEKALAGCDADLTEFLKRRQRNDLVQSAGRHILRMQKALTQMNLQLANVLTDISGATGQAIIKAILAGEHNPHKLAEFRDPRVKASEEQIAQSLEGNWQEDLLFVLKQEHEGYEFCQKQMAECDRQLQQYLQQREDRSQGAPLPEENRKGRRKKKRANKPQFDLREGLFRMTGTDLTRIDGIDVITATTVISEAGYDMGKWKTENHFVSWLRLCPDNRISGNKVIGKGRLPTNNPISIALKMAASTLRESKTYLGAQFRRLRTRLGAPIAIKAMAAKLARLVYRMLRYGMKYVDQGAAFYELRHRELQIKRLKSKAEKLGYRVTPIPAAA